jgi:hypothetical protein
MNSLANRVMNTSTSGPVLLGRTPAALVTRASRPGAVQSGPVRAWRYLLIRSRFDSLRGH